MLKSSGFPEIERLYGEDFFYLQDNASFHKSGKTKKYLSDPNLIPFPARLPDLNCIENFWGLLQKNVNM